MTRYCFTILLLVLAACGTNAGREQTDASAKSDTTVNTDSVPVNNIEADGAVEDYATYFVVVADTSLDYAILRTKMFRLNKQFNRPIDTMGRYFNKAKNLIALPDNDEDEMYAGDYFPRRYPTEDLSLEYLNFYQPQARGKTIALIAGIYEAERNADSTVLVLKRTEKNAFRIKAKIYIGCMH